MRLHDWVSVTTMVSVTKSGGRTSGWNAACIILYSHCAKAVAPCVVTMFLSASAGKKNGCAPHSSYIKKQNPRVPLQASALSALVAPKIFLKNCPRLIFSSAFPFCMQPTGMRCIEVARHQSLVSLDWAGPGFTSGECADQVEHARDKLPAPTPPVLIVFSSLGWGSQHCFRCFSFNTFHYPFCLALYPIQLL